MLFLHGNTASSRMFELLLPLYEDQLHVILIDFLRAREIRRLKSFRRIFGWKKPARPIALLEHLNLGKVDFVGTSGGAWVAINAALEHPELAGKIVADSFDGRILADNFSKNLVQERANAKKDEMGIGFYQWCQGDDWESIVDMDTKALIQCAGEKLPLFTKPLCSLQVPLLLMGSEGDEMSGSFRRSTLQ